MTGAVPVAGGVRCCARETLLAGSVPAVNVSIPRGWWHGQSLRELTRPAYVAANNHCRGRIRNARYSRLPNRKLRVVFGMAVR